MMATESDKTMPDWDRLFEPLRLRHVYRERFPKTERQRALDIAEEKRMRYERGLYYNRLWKDLDTEPEQVDDLDLARLAIKDESPTTRPTVAIPRPPQTIDLDLLGRTN